jgi:hypothetical protein
VRITLVHRAFVTLRAAGHALFRGWHPPGADRGVPGHQAERERESRETPDEPHLGLTAEALSNRTTAVSLLDPGTIQAVVELVTTGDRMSEGQRSYALSNLN